MKIRRLPFSIALIALFLFAGLQQSHAQMTVFNNTGCDLYVAGIQHDNVSICGTCGLVALNFIPAGQTAVINPNLACVNPEWWHSIYYTTNLGGPFGVDYSPSAPCGTNIIGTCNTNVTWVGTPPFLIGPVFVVIQ